MAFNIKNKNTPFGITLVDSYCRIESLIINKNIGESGYNANVKIACYDNKTSADSNHKPVDAIDTTIDIFNNTIKDDPIKTAYLELKKKDNFLNVIDIL